MKRVGKVAQWAPLNDGLFALSTLRDADPMWIWADATGYREHALDARKGVRAAVENPVNVFASRVVKPVDRPELGTFAGVELAEPVLPERWVKRKVVRMPSAKAFTAAPSHAELLVGIIDSGCPFAAQMVRTRVLALWDQDDRPAFTRQGYVPAELGYGCAVTRDHLNALIAQATTPDGMLDEDRCYRLAGYQDVMRCRFSHGAGVMSQLFAPPNYLRSLQREPLTSPLQVGKKSAIDKADLVFVQLPRAGVQDSTSAALTRYVIDGLRFIVAHAKEGTTKRIVVNISSGTSRTMHDGTSLLERAMDSFVKKVKAHFKIDLSIVVPMGNTNDEQRHAVLSHSGKTLEFFLPPDCEMPQYITVRWPNEVKGATLRVTPPGGSEGVLATGKPLGWPNASEPQCGLIWPEGSQRSLIVFAPTASHDRSRTRAPSGRWKIQLCLDKGEDKLPEPVRFWVSRNQRNPGALPRGRQGGFVDTDETHNPERHLRRTHDDPKQVEDGISRSGALSGMATGEDVIAVGGYVVGSKDTAPSHYSAAGPSAKSSKAPRDGPDSSAPGDISWALTGLPVRGNQSGSVLRAVGTSFAAPLVARAVANGLRSEKPDQPLQTLPGTSTTQGGSENQRNRRGSVLPGSGSA